MTTCIRVLLSPRLSEPRTSAETEGIQMQRGKEKRLTSIVIIKKRLCQTACAGQGKFG